MQLRGLSRTLAASLLLTWGATLAAADRNQTYRFEIYGGSIAAVLEQFTRQTGVQIGTQLNVENSTTRRLPQLSGEATIDQALKGLLRGTDLSYIWKDDMILIFVMPVEPPHAEDNTQEVLVTGTRLANTEGGPAPVRIYSRSEIERSGASSLPDFARYLAQQPYSFGAGHFQSGTQSIQLRGLGFDTTLVLINGRRVAPSANSISLNSVDLNNIPLTAVERIEVMSDSASAIYGTDAIGGVVNIILKDRIETPEVSLHYGQADGGGEQRRATVSLGTYNQCLKSTLLLDYYETGELIGAQRDLSANQDYRRFGGRDYRVSSINPGNVYSLSGQPLPGLSSSRAAVPFGTTGALSLADFFATDGVTNLYSSSSDWSITPRSERMSAFGSLEYQLGENISLFGELMVANGESIALRSHPSLSRQVVPATNPYNPFGVPVAVDYAFSTMEPISYTYDTDLLRLVGGARGQFGRWQWEISGLLHREHGSNTSRGAIDSRHVTTAVNSTDPQTALNLFSEVAGSPALLDSLLASPQRNDFSFASSQVSAFIRGPLFNLGKQSVDLVVGGEWRRDQASFLEGQRVDIGRDIASVFSEVRVPVLDNLSLKIAARVDDYGDGEPIVNPQYGLAWRPAKGWLFRAAYGTSFRPPSLFEQHMPSYLAVLPVSDPQRGGEVSNFVLRVGGNPDLDVVTAHSFTTGFVFSPASVPGLQLGASYWRVAMADRIVMPNYQALLYEDSPIQGRVARDVSNSRDVQAGHAGRALLVDVRRTNFGGLETGGADLDASLSLENDLGQWTVGLSATWVDEYVSYDMDGVLPANRVGIANAQGTIPEWRTVGTLSWKFGSVGATTTATFTPSYRDSDFSMGVLDRRIDSQTLVDVQTWVNLSFAGNALLDRSKITFGVRNVFDRTPTFANAGGVLGYDVSQADLTGRFIYMRISKGF